MTTRLSPGSTSFLACPPVISLKPIVLYLYHMSSFKNYIDKITALDSDLFHLLDSLSEKSALKKAEVFIHANSRFNKEIFIETGVLRSYIVDEHGNDRTTAFFTGGEFVSTNTFRTINGRSSCFYQALGPASIRLFDSHKLKSTLSDNNILSLLGREIKEKIINRINQRDECIAQVKATDRYLKFIEYYPDLEHKISHHYIATFLGITPVSLSRVRKKLRNSIKH